MWIKNNAKDIKKNSQSIEVNRGRENRKTLAASRKGVARVENVNSYSYLYLQGDDDLMIL
jgi:hypothetical protein